MAINGDMVLSKLKLGGPDFQANNQSNGMDDKAGLQFSDIYMKPMALFDWKVIVNLHGK